MALVKCLECQAMISDKAAICPQCGLPRKSLEGILNLMRMACWGFEWKSKTTIFGWPLVHIAFGRSRQSGKLLIARGIIAIGQFAVGLITIAQFGLGIIFGLGQFITGALAIGQIAFGVSVTAQIGIGIHVLAQVGIGKYVWAMNRSDPQAVEYFKTIWDYAKFLFR